jgi:2-polyprenyl-6-methoxyphenol hydroxylase-like FAD-dependent oxidoreductase
MRVEAPTSRLGYGRALVIGGSLAGMAASRVLVDFFDEVVIVERDRLPEGPEARDGLPQGRHVHVLLVRGLTAFEELFPGIRSELAAAGAEIVDGAQDLAWHTAAGWGVRYRSNLPLLSCSRLFLDSLIRRHIESFPRICVMDGSDVTGLVFSEDKHRVVGVSWRRRGTAGSQAREDMLAADLVVDASGRTSKVPQFLAQHGYAPPTDTVVDALLGYATQIYRRSDSLPDGWKGIYIQASPPVTRRGGVLLPIEGNRWIMSLTGGGGDYPPTDEQGLADFVRSLPSALIHNALKAAEPLSPVFGYRATQNRWRHYETLSRWPDGLVVLGDAACTFNPVYGQGMTIAALAALVLQQCLRDQQNREREDALPGLGRRFQKTLAKINKGPWLLATGQDMRYPGAQGGRTGFRMTLMHKYVDRITAQATRDADVRQRFLEVLHMTKPISVLFNPGFFFKVLVGVQSRGQKQ